jgi:hypothetical protein
VNPGSGGGAVGSGDGANDRTTVAGGNSSNRGGEKPVIATDSTVRGRPGDADIAVVEEPSRRSQPVGNAGGAVRGTDSAASSTTTGEAAAGNARRSRDPSVAGAITGHDAGKEQGRRGSEPGTQAAGGGAAAGAVADVEEHASLGIHRRFFPRPGSCRVWVPDLPNRRQATAGSCDGITEGAPAGAWILRRSVDEPNAIRVDYLDEQNAGVIVRTRVFNVATGQAQKTARRH